MHSKVRRGVNAAAAGAMLLALCCRGVAWAGPCDEYDPAGPRRSAQISLGPSELVDAEGAEMRSFVATGSIGTVEAAIVSAAPAGIVTGFSAAPEISRFSPDHGEALKGIAIDVRLSHSSERARVVISLRQVCARYFRNTFLYY